MPQYWWVPTISAAGFCLASWCQGRGIWIIVIIRMNFRGQYKPALPSRQNGVG